VMCRCFNTSISVIGIVISVMSCIFSSDEDSFVCHHKHLNPPLQVSHPDRFGQMPSYHRKSPPGDQPHRPSPPSHLHSSRPAISSHVSNITQITTTHRERERIIGFTSHGLGNKPLAT
jgi:hypothetical protein